MPSQPRDLSEKGLKFPAAALRGFLGKTQGILRLLERFYRHHPQPSQVLTGIKFFALLNHFLLSPSTAKSLPLHCVVESVSSLQATLNFDARSPWKRRPNIETDSYVIIPAATPFCDIVQTALQRLGYSSEISNAARGKFLKFNPLNVTLPFICKRCASS